MGVLAFHGRGRIERAADHRAHFRYRRQPSLAPAIARVALADPTGRPGLQAFEAAVPIHPARRLP